MSEIYSRVFLIASLRCKRVTPLQVLTGAANVVICARLPLHRLFEPPVNVRAATYRGTPLQVLGYHSTG